jgi:hypothetical protein
VGKEGVAPHCSFAGLFDGVQQANVSQDTVEHRSSYVADPTSFDATNPSCPGMECVVVEYFC